MHVLGSWRKNFQFKLVHENMQRHEGKTSEGSTSFLDAEVIGIPSKLYVCSTCAIQESTNKHVRKIVGTL